MSMADYTFDYVDSDKALEEWFTTIEGQKVVVLDTEFQRETTYFPKPALIQIRCDSRTAIIDPVAITNFLPLKNLLSDTNVVKVMHSCEEDLEVFHQLCEALPTPLFDTQLAAAFAGLGYSLSYSKLVEHFTGVQLDKSETRSDWLQRPLTESQLNYAAADVEWLTPIYNNLLETLTSQGRGEWCEEENEWLISKGGSPAGPELAYARIRTAWRFNQPDLVRLQKICEWREREAITENVPRGRVLADSAIVDLIHMRPDSANDITQIKGVGAYTRRKYGELLIAMLNADVEPSEYLPAMPDKRAPGYRQQVKALQQVVRGVAERCELPVELLGKKRDLEDYINQRGASLIANSWRGKLLVEDFEQAIAK